MPTYKMVDADQLDADLTAVANSIRTKGETTGALAFPAGFQEAIANISTGIAVQTKSGTFTTNTGGTATVNVGFQPDLVVVIGSEDAGSGNYYSASAPFNEDTRSNKLNVAMFGLGVAFIDIYFTKNSNGFEVEMSNVSWDNEYTSLRSKTFTYIAVKYT